MQVGAGVQAAAQPQPGGATGPMGTQQIVVGSSSGPERLMILFCGLMRTYKRAWPAVASALRLEDIEVAGGSASVIVVTSTSTRCSEKDTVEKRCPNKWLSKTALSYQEEIRSVYGRRLERIVEDSGRSFGDRLRAGLRVISTKLSGGALSALVALRPDVVFVKPPPRLPVLCRSHPGLNIISADFVRDEYFHNRDWNWGFVACDPLLARLHAFRPNESVACAAAWPGCPSVPPPLPTEFHGTWASEACSPTTASWKRFLCSKVGGAPSRHRASA